MSSYNWLVLVTELETERIVVLLIVPIHYLCVPVVDIVASWGLEKQGEHHQRFSLTNQKTSGHYLGTSSPSLLLENGVNLLCVCVCAKS